MSRRSTSDAVSGNDFIWTDDDRSRLAGRTARHCDRSALQHSELEPGEHVDAERDPEPAGSAAEFDAGTKVAQSDLEPDGEHAAELSDTETRATTHSRQD